MSSRCSARRHLAAWPTSSAAAGRPTRSRPWQLPGSWTRSRTRPRRRARAGGRQARARDRRRRRPQPAHGRPRRARARPCWRGGCPASCPPPTIEEALEITQIHSAAGLSGAALARERPFRAPHHTISPQGLVGGGATPQPGEITLAHRGVLFLDELAEFGRDALDALRQPLEDGTVQIMRGQRAVEFPGARHARGGLQSVPLRTPSPTAAAAAASSAPATRGA